jgi:hypothetical protein
LQAPINADNCKKREAAKMSDRTMVASDLADVNSFTLQSLRNSPQMFDETAACAFAALAAVVTEVKGRRALERMIETVRSA